MHPDSSGHAIEAHNDRAEDDLSDAPPDAENIRQIAVHFEDQSIMVPRGAWPEPHPPRTSNQSADHNHRDPQHDESENKSQDGELSLLKGVIAVAQRIGV